MSPTVKLVLACAFLCGSLDPLHASTARNTCTSTSTLTSDDPSFIVDICSDTDNMNMSCQVFGSCDAVNDPCNYGGYCNLPPSYNSGTDMYVVTYTCTWGPGPC